MSEYRMTIGLEIHAELKTNSKVFCSCKNDQNEKKPNVNICPVCMGMPGTLPVLNKEAVRKVLLLGKAVKGRLADFTEFDRKNYFYPDIPKGYQISQYKYPLVSSGELSGVKLTRIHLEEDTAKSEHSGEYSLIDFNRAGIPLMELVTEPVIHSAKEVSLFSKELQLLLQYLDIGEAEMSKGQMRVEVNISVSDKDELGSKVEIKNINSFKSAERAVEYEFKRQTEILKSGKEVLQETRGFDENKGVTFSQRSKENAHDYRYFPDPDLPKFFVSNLFDIEKDLALKETPKEKRERLKRDFNIKDSDIEIYISDKSLANLFEKSAVLLPVKLIQTLSNYIVSDITGSIKMFREEEKQKLLSLIKPESLSKLIVMIGEGDISSRGAKDILKIMLETFGDPEEIAKENNLIQKSDKQFLISIMTIMVEENKVLVDEYKNGKDSVLQFFIGKVMAETKGAANPILIKELLLEILKS